MPACVRPAAADRTRPHIGALLAAFLVGIAVDSLKTVLYQGDVAGAASGGERRLRAVQEDFDTMTLFNGIHGLLREWGCGHTNMETPRTIKVGGFGEVIVDIGLGSDAAETLDAVLQGFFVLAFEPMPENFASIRRHVHQRRLSANVIFIHMQHERDGQWKKPDFPMKKGATGADGRGFAYIINAAVGDTDSTIMLPTNNTNGALGSIAQLTGRGKGLKAVPQVRLDTVLPAWASTVHLLKIDTQGYELKVLNGALAMLRAHRFRHVLYEFSPWLMFQGGLGEPTELLQLMPQMNALCFDMMGLHNYFPHRQSPLSSYYLDLLRGNNSYMHGNQLPSSGSIPGAPAVGPWDDIMCWFPQAGERSVPLYMGADTGHKKFNEPDSFGQRFLKRQRKPPPPVEPLPSDSFLYNKYWKAVFNHI